MKLTFMHLENKTNKTSDTMEEKEMNRTWSPITVRGKLLLILGVQQVSPPEGFCSNLRPSKVPNSNVESSHRLDR